MKNGILSSMNEKIDFDTAAIIGTDLGFEIAPEQEGERAELTDDKSKLIIEEDKSKLKPRPPVIVVMGHVDHGKTKLLDTIRKTNVVEGEAGGITQHIGAYQISKKGRLITFIDTPGHEAFSMMRSRGAKIADIAILIIAADDGIQPQTEESIKIIKSAKLPMVVAINKIDKPDANPDKIKQELAQRNLTPEDWGGKTICVPISAKHGQGVDELLETLLLVADLNKENITANPEGKTIGTVIESHIDKGEGPVATVLVQNGTLKIGDILFLNNFHYGKVKALKDFRGQLIDKATPSMPVRILGLKGVPTVGDIIEVGQKVTRDQKLKHYQLKSQAAAAYTPVVTKKDKDEEKPTVNLILKADVLGSLEALIASLDKMQHPDVNIKIIQKGSESEVMLAEANKALILGFHVNATPAAANLAQEKNVEIKTYKIIYELLEENGKRIEELVKPEITRTPLGRLKVLALFRKEKDSQIVGGKVTKGKILPDAKINVIRDDEIIASGQITQLQVNKVDVNEAIVGQECGIKYEGKPIIQEGDFLEVYKEEVKKKKIGF
jgi:translation initiation factor IF-2